MEIDSFRGSCLKCGGPIREGNIHLECARTDRTPPKEEKLQEDDDAWHIGTVKTSTSMIVGNARNVRLVGVLLIVVGVASLIMEHLENIAATIQSMR